MVATYKEYRKSLPATDARPESVVHAEWAVSYHYFHLGPCSAQHGRVGEAETFVPAIPPEKLPMEQRVRAQALLARVCAADPPAFDKVVRESLHDLFDISSSNNKQCRVADPYDLGSKLHVRLPRPIYFPTPARVKRRSTIRRHGGQKSEGYWINVLLWAV